MSLLQTFTRHWQQQFPQVGKGNTCLLVAVSGGVDSTVLVDLVHAAGFSFTIAHMNFQLRGEESMRDEHFVRSMGDKYGCEVLVQQVETEKLADERGMSVQETARELRYDWFRDILSSWREKDAGREYYLLTAHHADDAIETMLMHFFRGTGILGLTGIPVFQKERQLLRPLLAFRKTELLAYAEEKKLAFVEDASNATEHYTRNFFRNRLLPQIREVFPQVESNLLHNMERFAGVAAVYQAAIDQQLHKLLEHKNGELHIPVLKWKKAAHLPTISWEIIKPYGFGAAQIAEVIRLLDAENGAFIASSTHRIIRNRNWMIITTLATEQAQHVLIEEGVSQVRFENGSLQITQAPSSSMISSDTTEAFIDSSQVIYPLILRKWKQGDYFYPLGMQKKKKLSRFLIDLKLSKTDKEKTWVIESNKKIIWVVGRRIDNRARITPNTRGSLHITWSGTR